VSDDMLSISEGVMNYRSLPLSDLLERVVDHTDAAALDEFHEHRTPFCHFDEPRLRFVEFLRRLCDCASGHSLAEYRFEAYDLTMTKFSRLGEGGVDCRNYFRPVMRARVEASSLVEREVCKGRVLQSMVLRHFYLSMAEARRNGGQTRYLWSLESGGLTLLMPRALVGRQRRRWLEANVPFPDPQREGEQDRVQAIVDQTLGQATVPYDENCHGLSKSTDSDLLESISNTGLVETIAQEKADLILEQRSSIQALGPKRLRELVLAAFDTVEGQERSGSDVAAEFGLSAATYSRFAGSNWDRSVPDLWRNTAQVLCRYPALIEAIKELGLWKRVKRARGGVVC
jgi:hypothetical protein